MLTKFLKSLFTGRQYFKLLSKVNNQDTYHHDVNYIKNHIKKIDLNVISDNKKEIRLFAIARNKELRLSHFIKYYKSKGVDRFFIIDNDSNDETINIALSHDNVHVFSIKLPYRNHWDWMEEFIILLLTFPARGPAF